MRRQASIGRKLWSRPTEAIFVWPGEEDLVVAFDGQTITVPPRHVTAKTGEGSPYRFPSVRNGSGDYVHGTVLVRDEDRPNDQGGYIKTLDVNAMCAYLTRDRDDLFNRGFNIVANVKEVATAMELGLPLYEKSQDERARTIIGNEMDRRRKFEEKGQPAPPSSSEHLIAWAITHLRRRRLEKPQFTTDALRLALEGRYDAPPSPAAAAAAAVAEQPKSGMTLYEECKDVGLPLNKVELQAILESDEEQMKFIRMKVAARREAQRAAGGEAPPL